MSDKQFNVLTSKSLHARYMLNQDSPRGDADGQSFIFGVHIDECIDGNDSERRDSSVSTNARDSGIESSQASPNPMPLPLPCTNPAILTTPARAASPVPNRQRRPSSALLHPDHARLLSLTLPNRNQLSPDQSSNEDLSDYNGHSKNDHASHQLYTASSSTTSSMTSIAGYVNNNRSQR